MRRPPQQPQPNARRAKADRQHRPEALTRRRIGRILEIPTRRRFRLGLRLTRTGAGLTAMLLMLGAVAANPGLNLLLLLFGLGVGMLLFNAIVARRQIRSIEVRRVLPDVAAAHRPVTLRYEITNLSHWTISRDLWIVDGQGETHREPPVAACYVHTVPPRGTVSTDVQITPTRRGIHRLGRLHLASRFPFGLVCRLRSLDLFDQLLVWPALWTPRFDWLSRAIRASQAQSARGSARQSGMDEFFGVREYRPGDNTRWIHWRRSAVLDRMVVREMANPTPGHITLALETVTSDPQGDPRTLDDLVSAAASLACDALERGWHVGLIANSWPQIVLPPAGGRAMRSRLLYELATLAAGQRERLAQVLENWPGGPVWAGRAVLLHASHDHQDPAIQAAASRLGGTIGTVTQIGPADLDTWFDRSIPGACTPSAVPTEVSTTPPTADAASAAQGYGRTPR